MPLQKRCPYIEVYLPIWIQKIQYYHAESLKRDSCIHQHSILAMQKTAKKYRSSVIFIASPGSPFTLL